jgi:hypothetical protein
MCNDLNMGVLRRDKRKKEGRKENGGSIIDILF